MEALELNKFFAGKRVFVTGHTGFKGSWLCLLLRQLGADVTGYALQPPTDPSLFQLARVDSACRSIIADVRDEKRLAREVISAEPEIVIHMAAQPLVRMSYQDPLLTYGTNVMGTVNLLEAVRQTSSVRAVVVVTTDKVYENREWRWGYREGEAVGGFDPYSSSKACAELATDAYRNSFFPPQNHACHRVAIATARAGNVIGGGDWAVDRLVPDLVRALLSQEQVAVRNPMAVRPWQHVFEPLLGYLLLAKRLYTEGPSFSGAWNFGPETADEWQVEKLVIELCRLWGGEASYQVLQLENQPHETHCLRLDSSKAKGELGWSPRWRMDRALASIVEWSRAYQRGEDMNALCCEQLTAYLNITGG